MRDTLKAALDTDHKGPKVIVASSECMLNRQRREKPVVNQTIAAGERVVKPRFGVDEDVCTGDHACIRLSGCPSLSLKTLDDPLRDDPVAHIDQSCVGCGNCGEVADAAGFVSFFFFGRVWCTTRAGSNGFRHRMTLGLIRILQRNRSRRVLGFEPG
ncbi:MAG: hypothetical protein Ct9H300mP14_16400 [Gammaproteobacteria bacterium]|nr:MAG: hypothetical protein Ct9H300mP14_16400 [Gammaproteobacteria bacterium]